MSGDSEPACPSAPCIYFVLDANGLEVIWYEMCAEGMPGLEQWQTVQVQVVLSCFSPSVTLRAGSSVP